MVFHSSNYWALILGGSSGFGLATAKKLSSMGMGVFIVHRDRRATIDKIQKEFESIQELGSPFQSLNIDALSQEGMEKICDELRNIMGKEGKNGGVRLLMHSIAFGSLKLIAPQKSEKGNRVISKLASVLGISEDKLADIVTSLFQGGEHRLADVVDPFPYENERFINNEDMQNTIYAMGSSLLTYTQKLFQEKLFSSDARVIGMTSEGNEIAWRGYAAVSAAKVVLESIMRSIAVEFAPFGIRANIVQAGVTDTPALRLIPGSHHLMASAKKRNPFKRLTNPMDVANVIATLVMEETAWVNGNIIRVDGGEHISGT